MDNLLTIESGVRDIEGSRAPTTLDLMRVADVPKARVQWLWPGRIALGKVTLLAGDPGLGKSMVTLDIAARVSRGANWPEVGSLSRGEPAHAQGPARLAGPTSSSVVLLSAEDDVADTIRPRLEAHGADCERIHAVRAVTDCRAANKSRSLDLSRDLGQLETLFDQLADCRLLVIDPVSAYLGRNIENTNTEVRHLLGPLMTLAAKRNLAVLAVTHFRKKEGAAMYRTMGSMAFVAAARATWIVCADKHDPRRRLLLPVKNNLAESGEGLAYTIEPRGPNGEAVVRWSAEVVDTPADAAMERPARRAGRPDDERAEVMGWLAAFLAGGPQPAALVREAAIGQGFAGRTLRRAFSELGGVARRAAGKNEWEWRLGEEEDVGAKDGDESLVVSR